MKNSLRELHNMLLIKIKSYFLSRKLTKFCNSSTPFYQHKNNRQYKISKERGLLIHSNTVIYNSIYNAAKSCFFDAFGINYIDKDYKIMQQISEIETVDPYLYTYQVIYKQCCKLLELFPNLSYLIDLRRKMDRINAIIVISSRMAAITNFINEEYLNHYRLSNMIDFLSKEEKELLYDIYVKDLTKFVNAFFDEIYESVCKVMIHNSIINRIDDFKTCLKLYPESYDKVKNFIEAPIHLIINNTNNALDTYVLYTLKRILFQSYDNKGISDMKHYMKSNMTTSTKFTDGSKFMLEIEISEIMHNGYYALVDSLIKHGRSKGSSTIYQKYMCSQTDNISKNEAILLMLFDINKDQTTYGIMGANDCEVNYMYNNDVNVSNIKKLDRLFDLWLYPDEKVKMRDIMNTIIKKNRYLYTITKFDRMRYISSDTDITYKDLLLLHPSIVHQIHEKNEDIFDVLLVINDSLQTYHKDDIDNYILVKTANVIDDAHNQCYDAVDYTERMDKILSTSFRYSKGDSLEMLLGKINYYFNDIANCRFQYVKTIPSIKELMSMIDEKKMALYNITKYNDIWHIDYKKMEER